AVKKTDRPPRGSTAPPPPAALRGSLPARLAPPANDPNPNGPGDARLLPEPRSAGSRAKEHGTRNGRVITRVRNGNSIPETGVARQGESPVPPTRRRRAATTAAHRQPALGVGSPAGRRCESSAA